MNSETMRGIERLQMIFEGNHLNLDQPQEMNNGFSLHFVVRGVGRNWDFCLSREVLDDLPAMLQYQKSAAALAQALQARFKNVSPTLFLSGTSRLLNIEVEWPLQPYPQRAASYLRVSVTDRNSKEFAHCVILISHQQNRFELKEDPFRIHSALVNSIRRDVDQGKIAFYSTETTHPNTLQEIKLDFAAHPPTDVSPEEYLRAKVFWLGFRAGNKDTLVWIADPWDADYLGTLVPELRQSAEILEAHEYLRLDESREFAHADDGLLREMAPLGQRGEARAQSRPTGSETFKTTEYAPTMAKVEAKTEVPQWDAFVCHASEDKEDFVRPLAEELRSRGLRIWYDEFALQVGDSLRRAIDHGLQYSRFGVVVLSPAFFAKDWPQRELDGLVAKEVEGQKVILPVWHKLGVKDVRKCSLLLADRVAAKSEEGMEAVVNKLLGAMEVGDQRDRPPAQPATYAAEKGKSSHDTEPGTAPDGLSVSLTQGLAEWFAVLVKNEMDSDVIIKKVVLMSEGIRLTNPALPPSDDAWKVPAHGRLAIEWKATPDPTNKLQLIYENRTSNPPKPLVSNARIEFIFFCETLGKSLKHSYKMLVQVDQNRRIWEL
jgi:hypothetical protein